VTKVGRDHSRHRGGRYVVADLLSYELRALVKGPQDLRDLLAELARGGAE